MKRVIMTERQLLRQRRELLLKLQAALHAPHAQFIAGGRKNPESAPPPPPDVGESPASVDVSKPSVVVPALSRSYENSVEKDDWLTTDAESGNDEDEDDNNVNETLPCRNDEVKEAASNVLDGSTSQSVEKSTEVTSEKSTKDSDFDVETLDPKQLEEKVAENLQELRGDDKSVRHWGPKVIGLHAVKNFCERQAHDVVILDSKLHTLILHTGSPQSEISRILHAFRGQ